MWDKRAEFLKLTDDNKIKMILDQGFGDTKLVTLRLLGIYSQAVTPKGAEECKQFIKDWFEKNNPKKLRWGFIVTTSQISSNEFVGLVTDIGINANLNAELADFINANGYQ